MEVRQRTVVDARESPPAALLFSCSPRYGPGAPVAEPSLKHRDSFYLLKTNELDILRRGYQSVETGQRMSPSASFIIEVWLTGDHFI